VDPTEGYTKEELRAIAAPLLDKQPQQDPASGYTREQLKSIATGQEPDNISEITVTAPRKPGQSIAQPASRDWSQAPMGDVLASAAYNLPGSTLKAVKGIFNPIFGIAHHPKDYAPNPGGAYPEIIDTAVSAGELAKGAYSAGLGFLPENVRHALPMGNQAPEQKRKDEELLNALANDYKYRYGKGWKETLATDPMSYASDLGAGASALVGGEGLAARIPGALGKAAQTGIDVAKAVDRYTNPISLGSAVASKVLPKGNFIDSAGRLTTPAQKAVKQAFPQGTIAAEDLMAPDFAATAHAITAQKGASPASLKEAILTHLGAPAPTAVVTGVGEVPAEAADTVRRAIDEGHTAVANRAAEISGAHAPSVAPVADSLKAAFEGSENLKEKLYKDALSHEGNYDPATFTNALFPKIAENLKEIHVPQTAQGLGEYPGRFSGAKDALNWLNDHFNGKVNVNPATKEKTISPGLIGNNDITPNNIEGVRRELNTRWRSAKGEDRAAIGRMRDAIDSALIDPEVAKSFAGKAPDGGPAPDGETIANSIKAAREAHKTHLENFESTNGDANKSVAHAVDELTASNGDYTRIGPTLNALINPKTLAAPSGAPGLYQKMSSILDDEGKAHLDNYIRQTVTASVPDSSGMALKLKASPQQIHDFLKGPLADVFTPEEGSNLRLIAEGKRILGAGDIRLKAPKSRISEGVNDLIKTGASWAIGNTVAGPTGGWLANEARRGAEKMLTPDPVAAAMAGAPKTGVINAPGQAARFMAEKPPLSQSVMQTLNQANREPENPQNAIGHFAGGRVGRASGGKVSRHHEHLVLRLMDAADATKKATNKITKPLLNAPDAHIVKALSVAKRAI
jgi:hypothetical protein